MEYNINNEEHSDLLSDLNSELDIVENISISDSYTTDNDDELDNSNDKSVEVEKLKLAYETCLSAVAEIKSIIIKELSGCTNKESIEYIVNSIASGRCSFTKSFNYPLKLYQDNKHLKDYHLAAIHWLITLYRNGCNGLLADEMGLGKTVETIQFLLYCLKTKLIEKPILIVCPTGLIENWLQEFNKWTTGLRIIKYYGSVKYRKKIGKAYKKALDTQDIDFIKNYTVKSVNEHRYCSSIDKVNIKKNKIEVSCSKLNLEIDQDITSQNNNKQKLEINNNDNLVLNSNTIPDEVMNVQQSPACNKSSINQSFNNSSIDNEYTKTIKHSINYEQNELDLSSSIYTIESNQESLLSCKENYYDNYIDELNNNNDQGDTNTDGSIELEVNNETTDKENSNDSSNSDTSESTDSDKSMEDIYNSETDSDESYARSNSKEKHKNTSTLYAKEQYPLQIKSTDYNLPVMAAHIFITSHNLLASKKENKFFKNTEFGFLVIDEAHLIKSRKSVKFKKMNKLLKCNDRLLITGTPVQNHLDELKCLLEFLNPYKRIKNSTIIDAEKYFCKYVYNTKNKNNMDVNVNATAFTNNAAKSKNDKLTKLLARNRLGSKRSATPEEIEFNQLLYTPVILRRLKKDVMTKFVQKNTFIEYLDLTPLQKILYQQQTNIARNQLNKHSPETQQKYQHNIIKNLFFRLRRVCNHPLLCNFYYTPQQIEQFIIKLKENTEEYNDYTIEIIKQQVSYWCDFNIHSFSIEHKQIFSEFIIPNEFFLMSCKLARMLQLVESTCAQNKKLLIFSQFNMYLDIIQYAISQFLPQFKYVRLDGSTTTNERMELVKDFSSSNSDKSIFLLSTRAGGLGLNLIASNTVILMDQHWNPHNDRQAEDRVHRLGQSEDVTIYRLCCTNTFEQAVLSINESKLKLDQAFGGQEEIMENVMLQVIQNAETNTNTANENIADLISEIKNKIQ